jgi:thiamine-phosphate pyrophosphorylase
MSIEGLNETGHFKKKFLLSQGRLYGILDLGYVPAEKLKAYSEQLAEGRVDILQLRAKNLEKKKIADLAREIQSSLVEKEILFIINDYPDIALEIEADGVHLGQEDMPIEQARKYLGEEFLIGKSTHTLSQALTASQEPVDYIAFGPIFKTPTKPDYLPVGIESIAAVKERIKKPVFFIGGINKENISLVLSAGADRIVMVSALLGAKDIPEFCRQMRNLLSLKGLLAN